MSSYAKLCDKGVSMHPILRDFILEVNPEMGERYCAFLLKTFRHPRRRAYDDWDNLSMGDYAAVLSEHLNTLDMRETGIMTHSSDCDVIRKQILLSGLYYTHDDEAFRFLNKFNRVFSEYWNNGWGSL